MVRILSDIACYGQLKEPSLQMFANWVDKAV